jgi:XTP/dITP diphosphohydrolase
MQLVFATNNNHKLKEIRDIAGRNIIITGLEESGFYGEIPEDFDTIEQNASQKAHYIYNKLKMNCFADDTGLEVDCLGGEPGVYSARYSRMAKDRFAEMGIVEGNISKLLWKLKNEQNRGARFRTVISLILNGQEFQFEGIVNGKILKETRGDKGFGYDPLFMPEGYSLSFAQLSSEEKNRISHRSKAVSKLISFLKNIEE